jgi:hypothetical protein
MLLLVLRETFTSSRYNETNVMHFLFNLLIIKGLYMFRALLAHPQEALHKRHLAYCVRVMSAGCYQGWSGTQLHSNPGSSITLVTLYWYTGWFISPSGMSDLCGTVAGMVAPKGSMSTEEETLQVSVLPYRYWYAPFCCVCLCCCAAEFGSSGGTYELPRTTMHGQQNFKFTSQ